MWDVKRRTQTGVGDPAVGGRRSAVGKIGEALRPESKSFSDP